jgi:hypothetical protein
MVEPSGARTRSPRSASGAGSRARPSTSTGAGTSLRGRRDWHRGRAGPCLIRGASRTVGGGDLCAQAARAALGLGGSGRTCPRQLRSSTPQWPSSFCRASRANELPADPPAPGCGRVDSVTRLADPTDSLESLGPFATPSLQGRSDEQRSWDLHLACRSSANCGRESEGTVATLRGPLAPLEAQR